MKRAILLQLFNEDLIRNKISFSFRLFPFYFNFVLLLLIFLQVAFISALSLFIIFIITVSIFIPLIYFDKAPLQFYQSYLLYLYFKIINSFQQS